MAEAQAGAREPPDGWLRNPAGQRGDRLHPRHHLRRREDIAVRYEARAKKEGDAARSSFRIADV